MRRPICTGNGSKDVIWWICQLNRTDNGFNNTNEHDNALVVVVFFTNTPSLILVPVQKTLSKQLNFAFPVRILLYIYIYILIRYSTLGIKSRKCWFPDADCL